MRYELQQIAIEDEFVSERFLVSPTILFFSNMFIGKNLDLQWRMDYIGEGFKAQ
jgi:hypothetical protein